MRNYKIRSRMKDFSELSIQELVKLIEEKDIEIEKLNGLLEMVFRQKVLNENKTIKDGSTSICFKQNWDLITKIIFIIKKADRPLQSREILSMLQSYYDNANYWSKKEGTLSSLLNRSIKYKKLFCFKVPGTRSYYYVLPEWCDENGSFKGNFIDKDHLR